MDKFLLADNPMRPDDTGLFILHMLDPVAIIQVDEGHSEFAPGKFYKHFDTEDEEFTLSIYFLFTKEFDADQHAKVAEHIIDRAWRWYRSYIEWEDKQNG